MYEGWGMMLKLRHLLDTSLYGLWFYRQAIYYLAIYCIAVKAQDRTSIFIKRRCKLSINQPILNEKKKPQPGLLFSKNIMITYFLIKRREAVCVFPVKFTK